MGEKKSYRELLLDPRWQRRRLDILTRDDWTCRDCESKEKTLHVHHTVYQKGRLPWEYDDDQLVTLCAECHEQGTHAKQRIDEALGRLRRDSYSEVLGFIEGRAALDWAFEHHGEDRPIEVPDNAFATGLGLSIGLSAYDGNTLFAGPGITVGYLLMVMEAHRERSKSFPGSIWDDYPRPPWLPEHLR